MKPQAVNRPCMEKQNDLLAIISRCTIRHQSYTRTSCHLVSVRLCMRRSAVSHLICILPRLQQADCVAEHTGSSPSHRFLHSSRGDFAAMDVLCCPYCCNLRYTSWQKRPHATYLLEVFAASKAPKHTPWPLPTSR